MGVLSGGFHDVIFINYQLVMIAGNTLWTGRTSLFSANSPPKNANSSQNEDFSIA